MNGKRNRGASRDDADKKRGGEPATVGALIEATKALINRGIADATDRNTERREHGATQRKIVGWTAAAVVMTGLGLILLGWQNWLLRDSNRAIREATIQTRNLTIATERALVQFDTVDGRFTNNGLWFGGEVYVKNVGRNAATYVRILWYADLLAEPLPETMNEMEGMTYEGPLILAAGEPHTMSFGRALTEAEAIAMNIDKTSKFYVYGKIDYWDAIGTEGYAGFCLEYRPDRGDWRIASRDWNEWR